MSTVQEVKNERQAKNSLWEAQAVSDWAAVLNTKQGRNVIREILNFADPEMDSGLRPEIVGLAAVSGRKDVAILIREWINRASPEARIEMLTEQITDEMER